MSIRMFDEYKFDDPWYRTLTPAHKCFWEFILSKCDIAGVWKVDFPAASWYIGCEIKKDEVLTIFKDRVRILSEDEWFIEKFILFQQKVDSIKDLNPSNGCHRGIIKRLTSRGLIKGSRGYLGASKPLPRGIGIGNNNDNNKQHISVFEYVWSRYPKKLGKHEALKHFYKTVITEEDKRDLLLALENFLSSRQGKGDPKYIPYGSSWFNKWQDWVNYKEPLSDKEMENERRKSIGLRPKS